jgi:hypothetical protein
MAKSHGEHICSALKTNRQRHIRLLPLNCARDAVAPTKHIACSACAEGGRGLLAAFLNRDFVCVFAQDAVIAAAAAALHQLYHALLA